MLSWLSLRILSTLLGLAWSRPCLQRLCATPPQCRCIMLRQRQSQGAVSVLLHRWHTGRASPEPFAVFTYCSVGPAAHCGPSSLCTRLSRSAQGGQLGTHLGARGPVCSKDQHIWSGTGPLLALSNKRLVPEALDMPFISSMPGPAVMTWRNSGNDPDQKLCSFPQQHCFTKHAVCNLPASADSRDGNVLRGRSEEGSHQLRAAQEGHLEPQPQLEGIPMLQ